MLPKCSTRELILVVRDGGAHHTSARKRLGVFRGKPLQPTATQLEPRFKSFYNAERVGSAGTPRIVVSVQRIGDQGRYITRCAPVTFRWCSSQSALSRLLRLHFAAMREAICIHIGQARACASPKSLAARGYAVELEFPSFYEADSSKASKD